jgi:hypothetical protein
MLPTRCQGANRRDCEVQLLDTAVYPEDLVASDPAALRVWFDLTNWTCTRASNHDLFPFIFEFSLHWHRDTTLVMLRSRSDTEEHFFWHQASGTANDLQTVKNMAGEIFQLQRGMRQSMNINVQNLPQSQSVRRPRA